MRIPRSPSCALEAGQALLSRLGPQGRTNQHLTNCPKLLRTEHVDRHMRDIALENGVSRPLLSRYSFSSVEGRAESLRASTLSLRSGFPLTPKSKTVGKLLVTCGDQFRFRLRFFLRFRSRQLHHPVRRRILASRPTHFGLTMAALRGHNTPDGL